MKTRATILAALAAVLVDGCACDTVPDNALTACDLSQVVQGAVKTDILFVVDDSGSMQANQTNLANNLSTFINALKSSAVANDFQIGVTTTSVSDFTTGATPALVGEQGCLVGPILQGSSATLVADFQGQVAVGTGGSGKEQPLRAMKLALTTPLRADCAAAGYTSPAGLLRTGARLAVVILTDEDDNSDSDNLVLGTTTTGNNKTHNDAGDGVDYKFTVEDPISDYVGFLKGPIGGETRDVVLAVIAGVDPISKLPTCGYTSAYGNNNWGCRSPVNDLCVANTCGVNSVTNPAAAPNLTMDVYCCGGTTGTACNNSRCATALDKADRLAEFVQPTHFPANKVVVGSICDTSFATTLQQIAGLIISPTVPLSGEPADYRMMIVTLVKADGTRVPCTVGLEGSTAALTADAVFSPASGSSPASLTFQAGRACELEQGDRIKIDVVCAG